MDAIFYNGISMPILTTHPIHNPSYSHPCCHIALPTSEEYALAMDRKIKFVDISVMHWNPNLYDDDPSSESLGICIPPFIDAHQFRGDTR